MFVIWEPILPSDWVGATTGALRRISDDRARQYWDEGHVLAKQMARDARAPQPAPACCESDGVLWDLAAVYPAGAKWGDTLPAARVFDGPVVNIASQIEAALTATR